MQLCPHASEKKKSEEKLIILRHKTHKLQHKPDVVDTYVGCGVLPWHPRFLFSTKINWNVCRGSYNKQTISKHNEKGSKCRIVSFFKLRKHNRTANKYVLFWMSSRFAYIIMLMHVTRQAAGPAVKYNINPACTGISDCYFIGTCGLHGGLESCVFFCPSNQKSQRLGLEHNAPALAVQLQEWIITHWGDETSDRTTAVCF